MYRQKYVLSKVHIPNVCKGKDTRVCSIQRKESVKVRPLGHQKYSGLEF